MGRSISQSSQSLLSISPRNSSLAPVGLSAPTSFQFSPALAGESSKQQFLSFISNQNNVSESNRGAAGGQARNANDANSLGEKSVFVMNLEAIWNDIEADDELERLGAESNIESERCSNLVNPKVVMEEYVCPLLNTSLPFTRPISSHEMNENNQRLRDNPVNISGVSNESLSLEERLRRERQRVHSNGVTQFDWGLKKMTAQTKTLSSTDKTSKSSELLQCPPGSGENTDLRIIVPLRGNIYIQDGVGDKVESPLRLVYDKSMLEKKQQKTKIKKETGKCSSVGSPIGQDTGAIDPQLSPDGSMIAFVVKGDLYVMSCDSYVSDNEMRDSDDISCIRSNHVSETLSLEYSNKRRPTQITFGAILGENNEGEDECQVTDKVSKDLKQGAEKKKLYGRCVTHGLADFVAQEEMDRYQGFWWNNDSTGIIFARVDESCVPPYRISHHGSGESSGDHDNFEEHRYPFAGGANPTVCLGYVDINRDVILSSASEVERDLAAKQNWLESKWFHPPDDASEYLARLHWLPDGSACAQWQDRRQKVLLLVRHDVKRGDTIILHREESNVWINLHHMFKVLPKPVHPNDCLDDKTLVQDFELPEHSFSYVFASERTGYSHLYLYTYIPGDASATLIRAISAGEWIVESIVGIDTRNDLIYFTGTYDSPLEKHLYALPLKSSLGWSSVLPVNEDEDIGKVRRGIRQVMNSLSGSSADKEWFTDRNGSSSYVYPRPLSSAIPPDPIRLTLETGMHNVVMDSSCRIFLDSCSDLTRPPTIKIYSIPPCGASSEAKESATANLKLRCVLFDATVDFAPSMSPSPPELLSFPTSDGTATLHAALYLPNPKIHGHGPYPLICSVYGGPHVQRVNRSWSQCSDMRVQRLCSMGFAVVKCDNRGSSRRGLEFEGAIKHHLGRVEVLDQVAAVRHLAMKRIIDPSRVGIYGWSYGGYLAAMCLCRAPDIFKVGIAGAPVTSWDGYDTHYTERYMGLPSENRAGYQESAVLEHVSNMRGKLLIIHGLIDENVHFRHTARLINRMVETGKDYDLLLFPDERHSPRKLRDRIYMEKRMFDYFVKNLSNTPRQSILGNL
jgi:dipeptidyl-peptidase-4